MVFGFDLSESLSGTYYRLDQPARDLAIRLALHVSIEGIRRFARERKARVEGTLYADELAEGDGTGKPVSGHLTWKLFDEKRIPYDLTFEGDDGRVYRLRGQRDFFLHDAVDSLTILPASLYDEAGAELARATLRYDPRTELPATLRSLRPRLRMALFSKSSSSAR